MRTGVVSLLLRIDVVMRKKRSRIVSDCREQSIVTRDLLFRHLSLAMTMYVKMKITFSVSQGKNASDMTKCVMEKLFVKISQTTVDQQ